MKQSERGGKGVTSAESSKVQGVGGQLFTSVRGSGSVTSGGAVSGTGTSATSLPQQTVQVALQTGQGNSTVVSGGEAAIGSVHTATSQPSVVTLKAKQQTLYNSDFDPKKSKDCAPKIDQKFRLRPDDND
ncbi:hypothetical protein E2C01_050408 [Portunus trituberculatus]|uniref:Uncharacterized protein n=1 Tax=Portunus trituberculatus TaxID=210409 RepID=A0A5B7GGP7_PORTR|nr:hypothetical protein [Portunus trituberculatus]